jgi:hypothetical protein
MSDETADAPVVIADTENISATAADIGVFSPLASAESSNLSAVIPEEISVTFVSAETENISAIPIDMVSAPLTSAETINLPADITDKIAYSPYASAETVNIPADITDKIVYSPYVSVETGTIDVNFVNTIYIPYPARVEITMETDITHRTKENGIANMIFREAGGRIADQVIAAKLLDSYRILNVGLQYLHLPSKIHKEPRFSGKLQYIDV